MNNNSDKELYVIFEVAFIERTNKKGRMICYVVMEYDILYLKRLGLRQKRE